MTEEDEEFNRIERESDMRRKAVKAAIDEHREHLRKHMTDYERGVIDGRSMQAQSSVDKAVNAMSKREWVGLTDEDCKGMGAGDKVVAMWADRTLKEKNT